MPRITAGRRAHRGLILPALCGILALSACTSAPDSTPAPTPAAPTAAPTAATATTGEPDPEVVATPATPAAKEKTSITFSPTALPDGEHDAYVSAVNPTARTVSFDKVEWLSGAEADKAYQKANPGDTGGAPDGYFILNDNPLVRTLTVSDQVVVTVITGTEGPQSVPGTFAELPAFLATPPHSNLFKLTVKNGAITTMASRYQP